MFIFFICTSQQGWTQSPHHLTKYPRYFDIGLNKFINLSRTGELTSFFFSEKNKSWNIQRFFLQTHLPTPAGRSTSWTSWPKFANRIYLLIFFFRFFLREILTIGYPPVLRQPAREREEVPAVPQGDGEEVPVAGGGQDIPHLPPAASAALLVKRDVNEFPHFFSLEKCQFLIATPRVRGGGTTSYWHAKFPDSNWTKCKKNTNTRRFQIWNFFLPDRRRHRHILRQAEDFGMHGMDQAWK